MVQIQLVHYTTVMCITRQYCVINCTCDSILLKYENANVRGYSTGTDIPVLLDSHRDVVESLLNVNMLL